MHMGFGAFGKMPSVGDFFRIDAPAGFVTVWDDWIQRAMLVAQEALGSDWDESYMSAPIWRFSLSSGLAGQEKVMGVSMPSVDRVGRRFPLTLMAAVPTSGPVELDHFCEQALFEALEALALDALEDDMTVERLKLRLAAIEPPKFRGYAPVRSLGNSLVLTQADGTGMLPELAAGLVAERFSHASVWSTLVDDAQRLLVCDGLPEGPNMHALFHLNAPVWNEAMPI